MRSLFLVLLLTITSQASASLKLTLQANAYDKGQNTKPLIGLGWYQPLLRANVLALNSWVGYGGQALEDNPDVNWFVAKSQVDLGVAKRITLSIGYQYQYAKPYDISRDFMYAKVDYKLF